MQSITSSLWNWNCGIEIVVSMVAEMVNLRSKPDSIITETLFEVGW